MTRRHHCDAITIPIVNPPPPPQSVPGLRITIELANSEIAQLIFALGKLDTPSPALAELRAELLATMVGSPQRELPGMVPMALDEPGPVYRCFGHRCTTRVITCGGFCAQCAKRQPSSRDTDG